GGVTLTVVFAGLVGAILWNIVTWYAGLPSSSSHALIGGIVGATLVAHGTGEVQGEGVVGKVIVPALVAPTLAFAVAGIGILVASHVGFPLSTTHVISGAVMGAGAARRLSAVRWGVAGNIAIAWLLTLPAAGGTGAVVYGFARIFGHGAAGPLVVAALLVAGLAWVAVRRVRETRPAEAPAVVPPRASA